MMQGAQSRLLEDGQRLHLNHGPIDLIIRAWGTGQAEAYNRATMRFTNLLEELVEELPQLRLPCSNERQFQLPTARRMQKATQCFLPKFITPMAAVAGSVTDEILNVMMQQKDIDKIYVNNGGDSAFYLTDGQSVKAMIASDADAQIEIGCNDPFRGIATSGWRGRSQSLGIADSVSVVAKNAAMADAAATMIANQVTLPAHRAIESAPANEIFPDSDLGNRMVTTAVGKLSKLEIDSALASGEKIAAQYLKQGFIGGALITLKGQNRIVGAFKLASISKSKQQKENN